MCAVKHWGGSKRTKKHTDVPKITNAIYFVKSIHNYAKTLQRVGRTFFRRLPTDPRPSASIRVGIRWPRDHRSEVAFLHFILP